MARRRGFSREVNSAIAAASQRFGIPTEVLRGYATVESSGNPRAQTGSYGGLFQLSPEEFRRGGGTGSIYDPFQNSMAAGRLLSGNRVELAKKLGREPSWNEVYLSHQQGFGGVTAHLENPGRLAWENMAGTREGREKDAKGPVYKLPNGEMGLWSQAAVAGNIPPASGLDWRTATSGEFIHGWGQRLERAGVPMPATLAADSLAPQMDMNPQVGPRDISGLSAQELTRMSPRQDSPYETAMGPTATPEDVAASTPTPVVSGVEPTSGLNIGNIFGQKSIPGASRIGAALSAAGKAIASSGAGASAMTDPATQIAALDSKEPWPTIPTRQARRPPGR